MSHPRYPNVMTLAQGAESWARALGYAVPPRGTPAWNALYQAWQRGGMAARNPDEDLRELERLAASGDPAAQQRLVLARARAGVGPKLVVTTAAGVPLVVVFVLPNLVDFRAPDGASLSRIAFPDLVHMVQVNAKGLLVPRWREPRVSDLIPLPELGRVALAAQAGKPVAPAPAYAQVHGPVGARGSLPINEGDLIVAPRDSTRSTINIYQQRGSERVLVGESSVTRKERAVKLWLAPGHPGTYTIAPEFTYARIWREGREAEAAQILRKYLAPALGRGTVVHLGGGGYGTTHRSIVPAATAPAGAIKLTTLRPPRTPPTPVAAGAPIEDLSRDAVTARIRAALRRRSGKDWSVKAGSGTASGWIHISAPPRRLVSGYMTPEDAAELGRLLGDPRMGRDGESIPAGHDYYREYIQRAEGVLVTVRGKQYWDNPGTTRPRVTREQVAAELAALWARSGLGGSYRLTWPAALTRKHEADPRRYAQVLIRHGEAPVFELASQFVFLDEAHRLGLLAHEIGHVAQDPEYAADRAAARALGVHVDYDPRWPGKGLQVGRPTNPRPSDPEREALLQEALTHHHGPPELVTAFVAELRDLPIRDLRQWVAHHRERRDLSPDPVRARLLEEALAWHAGPPSTRASFLAEMGGLSANEIRAWIQWQQKHQAAARQENPLAVAPNPTGFPLSGLRTDKHGAEFVLYRPKLPRGRRPSVHLDTEDDAVLAQHDAEDMRSAIALQARKARNPGDHGLVARAAAFQRGTLVRSSGRAQFFSFHDAQDARPWLDQIYRLGYEVRFDRWDGSRPVYFVPFALDRAPNPLDVSECWAVSTDSGTWRRMAERHPPQSPDRAYHAGRAAGLAETLKYADDRNYRGYGPQLVALADQVNGRAPNPRAPRYPNRAEPGFESMGVAESRLGSGVSASTAPVLSVLAQGFEGGRGFTRDELAREAQNRLTGARGQHLRPGSVSVRVGLALPELERRGYVTRLGHDLNAQGRRGPLRYALTFEGQERARADLGNQAQASGEDWAASEIARLESAPPVRPGVPLSGPVYRPALPVLETTGHKLPALQKARIQKAGYRVKNAPRSKKCQVGSHDWNAATHTCTRAGCSAFLDEPDQSFLFGYSPLIEADALRRQAATGQHELFMGDTGRAQNPMNLLILGNSPPGSPRAAPQRTRPTRAPRAANPKLVGSAPGAHVTGVREAVARYQQFHGHKGPVRWRAVEINDGSDQLTEKAVAALGRPPETAYTVPFDKRSNKAGKTWEHAWERSPLLVLDPTTNLMSLVPAPGNAVDTWLRG